MPEGGRHAPVLIAASWQALQRALQGNPDTLLCNCTIVILFAGFYVEANLNYIAEQLRMTRQMRNFLNQNYPGLEAKVAWFYNEFVARRKATNRRNLFRQGIKSKIRRRFPGFAKLYRFRNDISHGVINQSARSFVEAQQIRQQAKDMVDELFKILQQRGHNIPRATTYFQAIRS